jgi:hypothetical protein
MKMKNRIRAILIGTFVIALLISSAKSASCETPTPDKYSKIFELDKNQLLHVIWGGDVPFPQRYTQTVKFRVNGGSPIEIEGERGSWDYISTSDNTQVEIFNEVTRDGVTYKAHIEQEDLPVVGCIYWKCRDILYWNFYNPMYAIITDKPKITIYAYQNDSETITRQNADLNYPELAFLTLVAVREYPGGRKELYEGDCIDVTVVDLLCNKLPYQLSNLTEAGGQFLVDYLARIQNNQDFEWKGFWDAVGYNGINGLKGAIEATDASNGNPASNNDLTVLIGKDKNPVVIGIRSWNEPSYLKTLPLHFCPPPPTDEIVKYDRTSIDIGLDIDNFDFSREEIAYEEDYNNKPIKKNRPGTGEHWTKDPGDFVVRFGGKNTVDAKTRKGRKYDDIYKIMVDVQKNPSLKLEPGGGVDWLQVAATDIYKNKNKVFNCVWEVGCEYIEGAGRRIYTNTPWRVYLNPYISPSEESPLENAAHEIRFNLPGGLADGFFFYELRNGIIRRKALHCYRVLPGMYVDDEEELMRNCRPDDCYVEPGGRRNPYLAYSFDSKENGYLLPNKEKADPVDQWLNGLTGDSIIHQQMVGYYITRIDDRLGKAELEAVFSGQGGPNLIPTDIPNNLPFLDKTCVTAIYLKGPKGTIRLAPWINITEEWYPYPYLRIYYTKGYQVNTKYVFEINAYPNNLKYAPNEVLRLIREYGYELYVVYYTHHRYAPYEYDASYFGVSY